MRMVPQTFSLTNAHWKNSDSFKSGDLIGLVMYDDPLPIHLAGSCSSKNVRRIGKVWWSPILLVNCSIRELRQHTVTTHQGRVSSDLLLCASAPWWNNLPASWGPTTLCKHFLRILRWTVPCKMDRKRITVHHTACQITRLNITWFFLWGFLRTRSTGHQYMIWQT